MASHPSLHIPSLPTELVDTIIDYLYDDKPCLSSLTLVSHQILPSARYHLFNHLRFATSNHGEESDRLVEFLIFHPDVATFVQKLSWDGFIQDTSMITNTESEVVQLPKLVQVLDLLPSLRVLILHAIQLVDLHFLGEERSRSQIPRPRALKRLVLNSLGWGPSHQPLATTSEVHALLSVFSSVRDLHFYNIFCDTPDKVYELQHQSIAIRPRQLRLQSCEYLETLFKAIGTSFLSDVENLSLSDFCFGSSHLGLVLEDLRPHILDLQLKVASSWQNHLDPIEIAKVIDVSNFSRLSTLCFWVRFPCHEPYYLTAWESIRLLPSFLPPSLQKVTIRTQLCPQEHSGFIGFLEQKDSAWVEGSFLRLTNLEEVEVVILDHSRTRRRRLEDVLSQKFPEMKERGMLRFTSGDNGWLAENDSRV